MGKMKGYIPPKKEVEPFTAREGADNINAVVGLIVSDLTKLKNQILGDVDSKIKETDQHIENASNLLDQKVELINTTVENASELLRNTKQEVIDLVKEIKTGEPGKDADEEAIVQTVLDRIPKLDEEGLTTRILSQVPKLDEDKLFKRFIARIPQDKPSLKIIQEKIEFDPMSVIDKILSLPPEKFKIKTSQIDGLEQTIRAFHHQLGRGYLHGGGDTVVAGSNITITTNANGTKTIASTASASPLTTKGDIFVYSTMNDRLPVGTDGQILSADSTQVTGLKWITNSGGSLTVGTTPITSGTNTRVLFDNAGVLGEYAISGTGNVAMTNGPTFTGVVTLTVATSQVGSASQFNTGIDAPSSSITFNPNQTGDFVGGHFGQFTLNQTSPQTITNASTLKIDGAPIAGTNTTITNQYALWVASGSTRFDGTTGINNAPSINTSLTAKPVASIIGSSTAQVPGTLMSAQTVNFSGATAQTGAVHTVQIGSIAITADTAGSVIPTAASFKILGAPTASGNASITTAYSLWVAAGRAQFDGTINGMTLTNTTGTLTLANGSTLATSGANSITLVSTGSTSITLPTTGTLATLAGTETFTNKRITTRATTVADATSISPNSDTTDLVIQLNTQATGTLTVNNPSGTPTEGQLLRIRLKSTNVQTFSWGTQYESSNDLVLPTSSTGSSKYDVMLFEWNTTTSKWMNTAQNFGFA